MKKAWPRASCHTLYYKVWQLALGHIKKLSILP